VPSICSAKWNGGCKNALIEQFFYLFSLFSEKDRAPARLLQQPNQPQSTALDSEPSKALPPSRRRAQSSTIKKGSLQMAQPIIPWLGGKRRLADHIIPQFPSHTCYVEVFAGGAALYFLRPPAEVEVLNDINGELINLYRVVQNHLEEFVRQFKWALSSREVFKWLQETPPHTQTDIQRAARFFYLQQHAFGGKVDGQNWGTATTAPPINLLRIEENLSAAHLRLSRAYIENRDWASCIETYDRPHTLFYLDPPYWQTAGYGVEFDIEQYEKMAGLMRSLKGKAILSINDHPDIRRIFDGFQMQEVGIQYTVGGGGQGVDRTELIIYSWDRDAEPAGLF
jgi:DNA adenine methylase